MMTASYAAAVTKCTEVAATTDCERVAHEAALEASTQALATSRSERAAEVHELQGKLADALACNASTTAQNAKLEAAVEEARAAAARSLDEAASEKLVVVAACEAEREQLAAVVLVLEASKGAAAKEIDDLKQKAEVIAAEKSAVEAKVDDALSSATTNALVAANRIAGLEQETTAFGVEQAALKEELSTTCATAAEAARKAESELEALRAAAEEAAARASAAEADLVGVRSTLRTHAKSWEVERTELKRRVAAVEARARDAESIAVDTSSDLKTSESQHSHATEVAATLQTEVTIISAANMKYLAQIKQLEAAMTESKQERSQTLAQLKRVRTAGSELRESLAAAELTAAADRARAAGLERELTAVAVASAKDRSKRTDLVRLQRQVAALTQQLAAASASERSLKDRCGASTHTLKVAASDHAATLAARTAVEAGVRQVLCDAFDSLPRRVLEAATVATAANVGALQHQHTSPNSTGATVATLTDRRSYPSLTTTSTATSPMRTVAPDSPQTQRGITTVSTATSPIRVVRSGRAVAPAELAPALPPMDPQQRQHQQQQQHAHRPASPPPRPTFIADDNRAALLNRSVVLSPGQGHASFFGGVMSPAADASFMWDPACDVPLVATGDEPQSLLAELLAQSTLKLIEAHNKAQEVAAAACTPESNGRRRNGAAAGAGGMVGDTADESKSVLAELLAQSTKQLLVAHQQAAMLEQGYISATDFEVYRNEVENQIAEFDKFRADLGSHAAAADAAAMDTHSAHEARAAALEGKLELAVASRSANAAASSARVGALETELRDAKIAQNMTAGHLSNLERAMNAAQQDAAFLTAELQDARAELGQAEARHAFEMVNMEEQLHSANAKGKPAAARVAQLEREKVLGQDAAAQLAALKREQDAVMQKKDVELAAAVAARSAAVCRVLELEKALASAQSAVVAQLDAARGGLAALSNVHARETAEQKRELGRVQNALEAALASKTTATQSAAEMEQSLIVAVDAHAYLREQLEHARGAAGIALGVVPRGAPLGAASPPPVGGRNLGAQSPAGAINLNPPTEQTTSNAAHNLPTAQKQQPRQLGVVVAALNVASPRPRTPHGKTLMSTRNARTRLGGGGGGGGGGGSSDFSGDGAARTYVDVVAMFVRESRRRKRSGHRLRHPHCHP